MGAVLSWSLAGWSQQERGSVAQTAVYADSRAPVEARITDLLSRMTVEEKVDAFSTNPTVPRLGVVGTGHVEGLHGLALGGPGHWEGRTGRDYETVIPTTTFPQSRGLGQTWDPALLRRRRRRRRTRRGMRLGSITGEGWWCGLRMRI